jgi:hypothetical protein
LLNTYSSADNANLTSPYVKGSEFLLKLQDFGPSVPPELKSLTELRVKIEDVFLGGNNSVALCVTDVSGKIPVKLVLKLFERTFSHRASNFQPATIASEAAYEDIVREGKVEECWNQDIDEDVRTMGENEAYHFRWVLQFHDAEVTAYRIMAGLQGQHIPKFFADVLLDNGLNAQFTEQFPKYGLVHGILIEFVEGFPLNELGSNAPEPTWAAICDQVISVVNMIGDHGILNNDTASENVLVRPTDDGHQVVFFDFAYCYPRSAYSSNEDWIESKRQEDEEARLGARMELIISRAKGKKGKLYKGNAPLPWTYVPSHRYGVPGYPLVPDENGDLVDPVIPEIHHLLLGAATEVIPVEQFVSNAATKGLHKETNG